MEFLNRNKFYFVCGHSAPIKKQRNLTPKLIKNYKKKFNVEYEADHWYSFFVLCLTCVRKLYLTRTHSSVSFSKPTTWLDPKIHDTMPCFFCVSFLRSDGFNYETRDLVDYTIPKEYVILRETRYTADRQKDYAIARDLAYAKKLSEMNEEENDNKKKDPNFTVEEEEKIALLSQRIVDNMARDLNLDGRSKEILGSRLKHHGTVTPDFRITQHRNRKKYSRFDECFSIDHATEASYCPSHACFVNLAILITLKNGECSSILRKKVSK